jgi:hypothetical protein
MENHQAAPGWLLERVRKMQQEVGANTRSGRLLMDVDRVLVYAFTSFRLFCDAPVKHLMQFLIALVVSVLGIVPGVLNMYGRSQEADIVSVSAGCIAGLLVIIQFFPIDEWIHPQN